MMLIGLADIPRFPPDVLENLPAMAPFLSAVMIRGKGVSPRTVFELGQKMRNVAPGLALIVNDRLDVARALAAEGFHLPADALPAAVIRRFWPGRLSASAHSPEEAAAHRGVDFYLWGNVFPTRSKPGAPPRDQSGISAIRRLGRPVLAVGGVHTDNVEEVLEMGFAGAAVADGLWRAVDPIGAARRLAAVLGRPTGDEKEGLWN